MTTGAKYLAIIATPDGPVIEGPWYTEPKAQEGVAKLVSKHKGEWPDKGPSVILTKVVSELYRGGKR